MLTPYQEAIRAFLDEPALDTFLRLRELVIPHSEYAPYDSDDEIQEAIQDERFGDAQEYIRGKMPNWILNPGIHMMLSFVAHKLGNQESAELEAHFYQGCVRGILSTGDGSVELPYLVMRIRDEYDILGYLDKEMTGQALQQRGDRSLDRMECADGSEIFFDITDPMSHLNLDDLSA